MNGLVYLRAGKFAALLAASLLLLTAGALPARAITSIKIAIAYDLGGRGDHGVNDSAAKGVDFIKKKYQISTGSIMRGDIDEAFEIETTNGAE